MIGGGRMVLVGGTQLNQTPMANSARNEDENTHTKNEYGREFA